MRTAALAVAPGAVERNAFAQKSGRSKYEKNRSGKCLLLQIEHDGQHRVIFTGSDVLIEQMEKYGAEVPFATTIKKIDRYYTLS